MIELGFNAVRLSLENMERVHSEGIRKAFAKFAFRLMNTFPPLKERFGNNRLTKAEPVAPKCNAGGSADPKLRLPTNDPIGIALGLDDPARTGRRLIVSATPTIVFTQR
jgi:hypothetical protein